MDVVRQCVGDCITNPKTHLILALKTSDFQGKVIKLGSSVFGALWRIVEANHCDPRAVKGLKKTQEILDTAHAVQSFFGAFTGCIPECYLHNKNAISLLATKGDVPLVKKQLDKCKYNEKATTTGEKVLAFFGNFFKGQEKASKIGSNCVTNPIKQIAKHFVDNQGRPLLEMSEMTKKIGEAGQYFSYIDHFAGFAGESAMLGFECLAYKNAKEAGQKVSASDFFATFFKSIISLLGKSLDIIQDIAKWIASSMGTAVPAWFLCSAGVISGVIGCYSSWLKTAPPKEAVV